MESAVQRMHQLYLLDDCVSWIKENNWVRVVLQFPVEALPDSVEVVKYLELNTSSQHEFFVVMSAACGVDYLAPLHLGAAARVEAIICFGNPCLAKPQSSVQELPVLFAFGHNVDTEGVEFLKRSFAEFDLTKTLIIYDFRYITLLQKLFEGEMHLLEDNVAKIDKVSNDWHFTASTSPLVVEQELSRFTFGPFSLSRELVSYESVIFVGTCQNLYLKINSPNEMVEIDPREQTVCRTSTSKELRKRIALVEKVKLKATKTIGIIFTNCLPSVDALYSRIKDISLKKSKKTFMITLMQVSDESKFGNFGEIDAFVIISACCCSSLIQSVKTNVPLITFLEYQLALGMGVDYGGISWTPTSQEDEEAGEEDESGSNALVEYKEAMKGSWFGLQVEAGLHDVVPAKEGQKGVASGYDNERE